MVSATPMAVLSERVNSLEKDIEGITESLREVNKALLQVIQLAVTSQTHDSAISRAHGRVDEISKVVHGGNGMVGMISQIASLQEAVRESIWFRRTVTGAIVIEAIGIAVVLATR